MTSRLVPALFKTSPIDGVELWPEPFYFDHRPADFHEKYPLGKQVEIGFQAQIEASPRFDLLAYGVQMITDGVTVGEFDFLVFDRELDRPAHIELAYKYYVPRQIGPTGSISAWIGPRGRDSLSEKLDKLAHSQFELIHHPAAAPVLTTLGIAPELTVRYLALYAELYDHADQSTILDASLSAESVVGQYCDENEVGSRLAGVEWVHVCERGEWLVVPHIEVDWVSGAEAAERAQRSVEQGRAVMLWIPKGSTIQKWMVSRRGSK